MRFTPPEQELADAIVNRDFDKAKDLQAAGVELNNIILEAERQGSDSELGSAFIEYFQSVLENEYGPATSKTPMEYAREHGNVEITSLLAGNRKTALDYAEQLDNKDVAKVLRQHGAKSGMKPK